MNKECILPTKHFQYACYWYLCSHLADAKVNEFCFVKTQISISQKLKLIQRNGCYFHSAAQNYLETVELSLALENDFFCWLVIISNCIIIIAVLMI